MRSNEEAGGRAEEQFISAVVPVADVKKLEALAVEADRTRSAELRRAIREYIEREEEAAA